MSRRIGIFLAIVSIALAPTTASADVRSGDADLQDMLCIVAIGKVTDKLEEKDKDKLAVFGSYFFGKLYGRDPGFNPGTYLAAHDADLNLSDPKPDMDRCMAEVVKAADSFADVK